MACRSYSDKSATVCEKPQEFLSMVEVDPRVLVASGIPPVVRVN